MPLKPRFCLILVACLAAVLGNTHLCADPLTGQDIEITTQLDNGPTESASVVDNSDGTQFDSSSLDFSWMIPGDYFSFGVQPNGLDTFTLLLSGNSTFGPGDVLDVSFTLPSEFTFDSSETAFGRTYFGASITTEGSTLSLQLPDLDTISGLLDGVNTPVEAISRVQVPDASSTVVLLAGAVVLMLGLAERSKRRRAMAA
jgi:hypothetical protein